MSDWHGFFHLLYVTPVLSSRVQYSILLLLQKMFALFNNLHHGGVSKIADWSVLSTMHIISSMTNCLAWLTRVHHVVDCWFSNNLFRCVLYFRAAEKQVQINLQCGWLIIIAWIIITYLSFLLILFKWNQYSLRTHRYLKSKNAMVYTFSCVFFDCHSVVWRHKCARTVLISPTHSIRSRIKIHSALTCG